MNIQTKLQDLGLGLPKVAAPAANYVPYVVSGNMIYVSGQIPFLNGEKMHMGRVGDDLTTEDGAKAAQACALNILAQVNEAVGGDWSKVKKCIKLGGFVNCTPDFTDQPLVINVALKPSLIITPSPFIISYYSGIKATVSVLACPAATSVAALLIS